MTQLPNPWLSDSAASPIPGSPDTVVASKSPPNVTAGPFDGSPSNDGGCQEALVASPPHGIATGATDMLNELGYYVSPPEFSDISDVGEIFYHARQLINEDAREDHRFRLDVVAFMEALDEPPLFLQRRA